jgi:hypothetical protein
MILALERLDVFNQAILATLNENTFSLMRNLAKRTYILSITVWRQLTDSIGFVVKHLHWVSYKLNDAQLTARIQMLSEVLRIVHSAEYQDWHYIIILDES